MSHCREFLLGHFQDHPCFYESADTGTGWNLVFTPDGESPRTDGGFVTLYHDHKTPSWDIDVYHFDQHLSTMEHLTEERCCSMAHPNALIYVYALLAFLERKNDERERGSEETDSDQREEAGGQLGPNLWAEEAED